MELFHLGVHCQVPSCHQLDYLPFNCQFCSHQYCAEHAKPDSHGPLLPSHKSATEPGCPGMLRGLHAGKEPSNPSLAPSKLISTPSSSSSQSPSPATNCPHPKCKSKRAAGPKPVLVHCNGCQVKYCLQHRYRDVHDCGGARLRAAEAAAARNMPSLMRTGSVSPPLVSAEPVGSKGQTVRS